jgi:hypothetical protein
LKTFITFICALMLIACGSTSKTVANGSTPIVADGPPWELLPEAEQSVYLVDHACPDATDIVDSFSGWTLVGPDIAPNNPEEVAPGVFIEVLVGPSGMLSMVQYVENDEDGRVNQMAMLFLAEGMGLTMIDYNILRAFHTGAVSPDDEEALSLATGEYFCVYM